MRVTLEILKEDIMTTEYVGFDCPIDRALDRAGIRAWDYGDKIKMRATDKTITDDSRSDYNELSTKVVAMYSHKDSANYFIRIDGVKTIVTPIPPADFTVELELDMEDSV